ncbi:hypothetical protein QZM52_25040 [Burkholderia metallica]|uniref:Uncharacterized protein n=1 Tax=Burkholderia metallica TaxID=488729 RepID=A0ABT8PHE3_9BURK|nr:hypothetical protein [Burkholderia metallica]MDN7934558.1 hypothetical protein [Burkholderia metallica]
MTAAETTSVDELSSETSLNPAAGRQQHASAATESQPGKEIFIVQANTMYEGSDPVRAFASRQSADAFAQKCRDHEAGRSAPPGIDAPEEEWDSWWESDRAWEQSHPAAPFSRRESYDVVTLAFEPS